MNPYEFSLLPRAAQIQMLRQMSPQQRTALVRDFKMIVDQSQLQGLGELSSWFSETFREIIQPILPYVGIVADVIYPGAGVALNVASRALFPAQAGLPQGQPVQSTTQTTQATNSGGTSLMPIAIGAGLLLLLSS